jgi:hypothetical protein
MKASKTMVLIIVVLIISSTAIARTLSDQKKAEMPFTIAITKAHAKRFEHYKALSTKVNTEVILDIYENESDLMKAVYSGTVDAYSINVFAYLEQFADLPKGKAILGLSNDYYLITKQTGEIDRPQIGVFDETLSFYLLHGTKYATITYSETSERLQALNDGFIDFAIVSSADYDENQAIIVKKMSDLGYTEDLFVLTRPWIDKDVELGLNIVQNLTNILTEETNAPDETILMKAMSELFKDEKIPTRYYYEDLVYFDQP